MLNELQRLYAEKLITLKEFTKGLLLLNTQSPISSTYIETLKIKSHNLEPNKEGKK
jgi:hypothetical protein